MRVGLISDIHGNLLALAAVLEELDSAGVDRIVCLGDVVAGPRANEVVARIRELGCPVVMGNWDAMSLDGMPEPSDSLEERLYAMADWWGDRLTDDARSFIETFVPKLELQLDAERTMLCFHGSPNSYDDWIVATTPDEDVRRMCGDSEAPVLAGGHTHLQMIRRYFDGVIVNPGSVGLPFRLWSPYHVEIGRWAEYGILSVEDGHLDFQLRRTTFDVDAHLRFVLESGVPYAEWWVGTWAGAES